MSTNSAELDKVEISTDANIPVEYVSSKVARYDDTELGQIKTFQDALAILGEDFMPEDYAETYGSGFDMLKDKGELAGKPLMIMQWSFNASKSHTGSDGKPLVFVSMEIVVEKTGEKYIANDGSGIRDQLAKVAAARLAKGASMERALRGLYVRGGFRLSTYPFTAPDGAVSIATSYYLAT